MMSPVQRAAQYLRHDLENAVACPTRCSVFTA
jgi:hypothetical protein